MDLLYVPILMVDPLMGLVGLCILIHEALMRSSLAVVDKVSMMRRMLMRLEILDEALWVRRACPSPLVETCLGA